MDCLEYLQLLRERICYPIPIMLSYWDNFGFLVKEYLQQLLKRNMKENDRVKTSGGSTNVNKQSDVDNSSNMKFEQCSFQDLAWLELHDRDMRFKVPKHVATLALGEIYCNSICPRGFVNTFAT